MNGFDFIMSSSFKREKYTFSCEYRNLFEIDPNSRISFCILHTFKQRILVFHLKMWRLKPTTTLYCIFFFRKIVIGYLKQNEISN